MGSPSKEKGKRRLLGFVFSFGYEKGAACLPCLGRWCLVTMRPLAGQNSSQNSTCSWWIRLK